MISSRQETILKVENVSLALDGKQILRNINLEIKDIVRPDMIQGQIVALVGQSGVGKSTLFRLLSGIHKQDTGTILSGPKLIPVKIGDMGVVYQNYYTFGWRRVNKILQMATKKNPSVKDIDIKPLISSTTIEFDIADHMNDFVGNLSGGQQQRVALAEQILCGNEFLLLDEPFSGLDYIMIDKVMKILQKVSCIDELKTLIIVSHDLPNTVAIADTVYVLAKEPNKSGGTIVKEIDLIERDLAWHEDVKEMFNFKETVNEIKSLL